LKLNCIAITRYKTIKIAVKLFKNLSAELGDPNKLLFVAKLASPPFWGERRKMIKIRKTLNDNQIKFAIIYC
jgi:hypothetical protein